MAYVVKAGDTLSSIAARNGTTVSALLAANPRKWPNPNLIQVGQTVLFPGETRGTIPSAQSYVDLPIRGPGTGENPADSYVNLPIRRPGTGENSEDSYVNLPVRRPGTGEKSADSYVNLPIPRSESSPRRPRAGENPEDSYVNLGLPRHVLQTGGGRSALPSPVNTPSTDWRVRAIQMVRAEVNTNMSDDEIFAKLQETIDPHILRTGTFFVDPASFGGTPNPAYDSGQTTRIPETTGPTQPEQPNHPQVAPPPGQPATPQPTAPPTPPQPAPPPPPIRSDFELQSSKAFITNVLTRYGLGELAGWAWKQIQAFKPDDQILLELRETAAYKRRFPGISQRFAAGLNAITEEEYLQLENTYHSIMRASGLPNSFYDNRNDFTSFIANDLSPAELQFRIDEGFRRVAQTDPSVRAAFQEFYGANGDGALAAMFLDPDRAAPLLIKQARSAEVAGLGRRAGVTIGQGQSEEIAGFSPSVGQIQSGFNNVLGNQPLGQETFTEFMDLNDGDLIAAAFQTSGAAEARQALRERRNKRLAAFSGGGGAAFFSGQGFVGLGVAGE